MFVAGVDGCSAGWVAFKVELSSLATSVETVDLTLWLTERPPDLAVLCIDIPIGLFDHPRACDIEARKLLGRPRRSSVFPPPCRAALLGRDHASASDINERATSKRLTLQTWCISGKIKQVDDIITPQKHRLLRLGARRYDAVAKPQVIYQMRRQYVSVVEREHSLIQIRGPAKTRNRQGVCKSEQIE